METNQQGNQLPPFLLVAAPSPLPVTIAVAAVAHVVPQPPPGAAV